MLILLGSDYTLPASVVEANAIRATLTAGTPCRVEFFTEALDANRLPLATYEADFTRFMQQKYRGRLPPVSRLNLQRELRPTTGRSVHCTRMTATGR